MQNHNQCNLLTQLLNAVSALSTIGEPSVLAFLNISYCVFCQVEILVGKDKGKQGLINCIIKERNWVYVEGLNCVCSNLVLTVQCESNKKTNDMFRL